MNRPVVYGAALSIAALVAAMVAFVFLGGPDNQDLKRLLADNGFIELRPPSMLVQPGTWVEVQKRNPLRLATVCSPQSALGLTKEQLLQSASANTSLTRSFDGSYDIGLEALNLGNFATKSKIVQSVELRLSKVRLIELADDEIFKSLPRRDPACAEAIRARLENNPDTLTMIDTVLIADAEYRFTFKGDADAGARSQLVDAVATKAGLSIGAQRSDSSVLIGRDLVWGVKDDRFMASQGSGLPSTGSAPAAERSLLKGAGAIEAIESGPQARRSFDKLASQIRYDVPLLKQPTSMSCWATVFAMMAGWKLGKQVTIEEALATLGPPYTTFFERDLGLPGGRERAFVAIAGMRAMPPASYPLTTFRRLLRDKGPVWVITGDGITSHARLLVGLYGPDDTETRATYAVTVMEFIDPISGAYVYETALSFLDEFEQEAAAIVNSGRDWIDLRWQVISF